MTTWEDEAFNSNFIVSFWRWQVAQLDGRLSLALGIKDLLAEIL